MALATAMCVALVGVVMDPTAPTGRADTQAPWPMFQHDPQHTGRGSANGPTFPAISCTYTLPKLGIGGPVVGADGTIYVPSGETGPTPEPGYLIALNPDCTLKWSVELAGPPGASTPAIGADGTIYVRHDGMSNLAGPHGLTAVSPAGVILWDYSPGSALVSKRLSSPVVASDGAIFFGSMGTTLWGVRSDGTLRCGIQSPSNSSIHASPALTSTGSLIVYDSFQLFATSSTCGPLWNVSISDSSAVTASPSLASDDSAFVLATAGSTLRLRRRAAADGSEVCAVPIPDASGVLGATPALATDGTVYVNTGSALAAVSPTCVTQWTKTFQDSFGRSIQLAPGVSPIVDGAGVIYSLREETWGTPRATLMATNPDGTPRWQLVLGSDTFYNSSPAAPSPALAGDGRIWVPLHFVDNDGPARLVAVGQAPPPNLSLAMGHSGGFSVGTNGAFTLTVTNQAGAGATTGATTVTDTLPAGLTFVSGVGTGWACSAVGQAVTCTRSSSLAPGASSSVVLTVGVAQAAAPSVTNQASVSTPGETVTTDNTASDTVPVSVPITCQLTPRPAISVVTTKNGDGRLRATITVPSLSSGPANTVQQITVILRQNAQVAVAGGPANLGDGDVFAPTSPTTQVVLLIGRIVQDGGATVHLTVRDTCAQEWRTFVGGGSGAWGP